MNSKLFFRSMGSLLVSLILVSACTEDESTGPVGDPPLTADCADIGLQEPVGGMPAQPVSDWQWRRSGPAPGLTGVAWGEGLFTAVGQNEVRVESETGWDWSIRGYSSFIAYPDSMYDRRFAVGWIGDGFLAVGQGGWICWYKEYSTTERRLETDQDLLDTAFSGSRVVVVGSGGVMFYTDDQHVWTATGSGEATADLNHIAWTGEEFLAIGDAGTALRSSDGESWQHMPSVGDVDLSSFATNCVMNVMTTCTGEILASPDGLVWNRVYQADRALHDVIWTGEVFIAVGEDGLILRSTEGTEWIEVDSGVDFDLMSLCAGNALVAVGPDGGQIFSLDGTVWHERPHLSFSIYEDVIYWQQRFVAVGRRGAVCVSEDGADWVPGATSFDSQVHFMALAGSDDVLIAATNLSGNSGISGTVYVSVDGYQWQESDAASAEQFRAAHWTGEAFLVGGQDGACLSSTDGLAWSDHSLGEDMDIMGIASSPSEVLAVLGSGRVAVEDEFGAWNLSDRVLPEATSFLGVCWDGSQYVALVSGHHVFVSDDGLDWEPAVLDLEYRYYEVVSTPMGYFLIGQRLLHSLDLQTWQPVDTAGTYNLNDLAWSDQVTVVVGKDRTLLSRVEP